MTYLRKKRFTCYNSQMRKILRILPSLLRFWKKLQRMRQKTKISHLSNKSFLKSLLRFKKMRAIKVKPNKKISKSQKRYLHLNSPKMSFYILKLRMFLFLKIKIIKKWLMKNLKNKKEMKKKNRIYKNSKRKKPSSPKFQSWISSHKLSRMTRKQMN